MSAASNVCALPAFGACHTWRHFFAFFSGRAMEKEKTPLLWQMGTSNGV
jgi:hypothetical protein